MNLRQSGVVGAVGPLRVPAPRLRILAAIMILVAMGLLAAASVSATRPWTPAARPADPPQVVVAGDPC